MKRNIFSDLRKPGLVPGKSLSLSKNYEFCCRETLITKEMLSPVTGSYKAYMQHMDKEKGKDKKKNPTHRKLKLRK